MMPSRGIPGWSEVSSTLLITVHARALEAQTKNPILHDPKAVEITRALDQELGGSSVPAHRSLVRGRLPRMLAVMMALRARFFDRVTTTWLRDHDREDKLGWWRWLGRFARLRRVQWTAVYRLGG